MTMNPLLDELCEIQAMKLMAAFEDYAKSRGHALEEITQFDLEALVERVKETRSRYPNRAIISFSDESGLTSGGTATTATGSVNGDATICPDGSVYVPAWCERAGVKEATTIMVAESNIVEVTKP